MKLETTLSGGMDGSNGRWCVRKDKRLEDLRGKTIVYYILLYTSIWNPVPWEMKIHYWNIFVYSWISISVHYKFVNLLVFFKLLNKLNSIIHMIFLMIFKHVCKISFYIPTTPLLPSSLVSSQAHSLSTLSKW